MQRTGVVLFGLAGLFLVFSPRVEGALIGYWPLDATSGTLATNLVPGGTNGVLIGSGVTWLNDAQRGQVLNFGTGSTATNYVDAGFLPTIGDGTNFTWSFWAYSQQGANNNVILGNRYDANAMTGGQWIKFTPSKFEFTTSPQILLDYADIPQNQWIHHAVVRKGSDKSFTYYRNGVAVLTTNITITTAITGRPFYMGGDKYAEWWQGRIDDVAIWTDALPSNAIAGLASGTYTPLTAPRYATGFFDLADALGGGDGTLPGFGGFGDLSATMGTYTTFPANLYVDGTFVPNTNTVACVIDGAGHTYDFNAQNSASINLPWRNGLNLDVDPSTNLLANFSGDPTNHSLISAHASKGITFDLDGVRAQTGLSIEKFTACIGDSRPKVIGTISYFVFVDGVLVTNRLNMRDTEDFVTVTQVNKGRYLTIAVTDANDGTVCDHGYLGDAFLTLIPYTPPPPPKGTAILIH
jgi:hypothetical protein